MQTFLDTIVGFPTVIFTTGLVAVLLYWGYVLVSGIGLDVGDAFGEGELEAGDALSGTGGLAAILAWLGFGRAPLSLLLSTWCIAAWMTSYLLARWFEPMALPGWIGLGAGLLAALVALVITTPVPHFVGTWLGALFEGQRSEERRDLVGRTCRITTQTVDDSFGQARLEEQGDWRVIQVRSTPGALKKDDQALISSWDADLQAFRVEPLTDTPGVKEAGAPRKPA